MRLISNKTAPELHPHTTPSANIYIAPGILEVVESIGCSQFSIFHCYHQKDIWTVPPPHTKHHAATGANRETFDKGGGIIPQFLR